GEGGGVGVEESGDGDEAGGHGGRVIKIIDRAKARVLGIFRALPDGGGRLAPIDKKQAGREIAIPRGAGGDAKDGDLVAVEVAASRTGYGLATARVKERLRPPQKGRAGGPSWGQHPQHPHTCSPAA